MEVLGGIASKARDRGRDGGFLTRLERDGVTLAVGQWRAAPTTEPERHGGVAAQTVAHNGTIANDVELGNTDGAIDSLVLEKCLDRRGVHNLCASLAKVRGSYALAALGTDTVYLAANYKPIHLLRIGEDIYFASMERHLSHLCRVGERPEKLPPYSVLDLRTRERAALQRRTHGKTLCVCSGGLDSTTAAWQLAAEGHRVELLHFQYGCTAETAEKDRVAQLADVLGTKVHTLTIDYSPFRGASPLLNGAEVATGIAGAEYAHEWVPARNLLMIAHAVAFAEANNFDAVALGTNLEESGAYPDNEEEFTILLGQALDYAVQEGGQVKLLAPVGNLMKHEIVALGMRLHVPYKLTWSCYRNGSLHCGRCGPCHMRREAFRRNGLVDPVRYSDEK
jgi:7-cyano-7-deazaguanine synthase